MAWGAVLIGATGTIVGAILTHPSLTLDLIANRKNLADPSKMAAIVDMGIMDAIRKAICDYAEARAGLVLDREDPFSDHSLSAAVGGRIGVPITSLKNAEGLKMDVARFAQGQIEARSGLVLTNILDADALRSDVGGFASVKVSDYVGVTITDVLSVEQTRSELTAWALDNFVDHVQSRLVEVVAGFGGSSADLSGIGAGAKQSMKDGLSASEVMTQAFAGLVAVMLDKVRRDLQRARRKEQNRQAQQRFRARHGVRMRYERLEGAEGP